MKLFMNTIVLLATIQYSYSSDLNPDNYNKISQEKQINLDNSINNINNNIMENNIKLN